MSKKFFTKEQADEVARGLGVDWARAKFDLEQFRHGMDVEMEHGKENTVTNVTNDDPVMTGKIALAHLTEYPDYYNRLDKLEKEAEDFWGK